MSKTVILKFGGAALATPASFQSVASLIIARRRQFERVIVVVSAMGDRTDQLVTLAKEVHPAPPKRELDMLISAGERVSIALLAMALARQGQAAVSFTGSQSGIITSTHHSEARIIDVRPTRLHQHLEAGEVVIVAGFQGVSENKEITTLGRGGSDTSAVALAVACTADHVAFHKDVGALFTADPRHDGKAKRLTQLDYEAAMRVVQNSAHAPLHLRSLALARANGLPLHVLGFDGSREGTWIGPTVRHPKPKVYE